jgi:hypothetical protein
MEIDMKLTTAYIRKVASRDKRIEEIEVCPQNQVIVWLKPDYTWNPNDNNVSVRLYNVEGSDEDYRDDVETFLNHMKLIEKVH